MLIRDSGAIQLFVENAQQAYDFTVMAPRIAEHPDVLLPVIVCLDGFTITHAAEPVELLDDDEVRRFVGEYAVPHPLLDLSRPTTQGPFAMPDYHYELKHQEVAAMRAALDVFEDVAAEYARSSGRAYEPFEAYRLDHAAKAVVALGSTGGTAKDAIDELREYHKPVGLLELHAFRPFPHERLRAALERLHAVAVLDRADSPGGRPPLFAEVATTLTGCRTRLSSYVYALGGRDLHPEDIRAVLDDLPNDRQEPVYVGLRSDSCPD
jgi:pyruvate ferredoxin oxidoreductase alpha subunit